jgi:DNA topoisomerase IB
MVVSEGLTMARVKVDPIQMALPIVQGSSSKSLFLVDELVGYETKTTGQAARHFGHGKESCHLIVAGKLEDLHVFAKRLGLRREWFQGNASWPHYDLTPNKRKLAISLGAIEIEAMEEARARIEVRRRTKVQVQMGLLNHIKRREEALDFMSRMLREYFDDSGKLRPEMLSSEEA